MLLNQLYHPCDNGGARKSGSMEGWRVQEKQDVEVFKVELEGVRHCMQDTFARATHSA